jgi:biopolymer transport protein ExbB
VILDSLYLAIQAGGWILLPIWLVGWLAFALIFRVMFFLGRDMYRSSYASVLKEVVAKVEKGKVDQARHLLLSKKGIVYKMYLFVLEHPELSEKVLSARINQIYLRLSRKLEKGILMVGVLAATAPLLGLLGTVQGMVHTFEVITLYGNSNPALLAGGISEALITTQSGLVIAFPMLLLKHRVEDRIFWVRNQIELGMLALYNALNEKSKKEV